MKKIKVAEATGAALNWMVAVAEGHKPPLLRVLRGGVALPQEDDPMWCDYLEYTDDWGLGGPIIEQREIGVSRNAPCSPGREWEARPSITAKGAGGRWGYGPTPLVAAMRCHVASELGDEAEVPEELL